MFTVVDVAVELVVVVVGVELVVMILAQVVGVPVGRDVRDQSLHVETETDT